MKFILLTVLCGLLHLTYGENCKKCMPENDAYCEDETTYHFCMDDNPLTTLHTCENGYICTDSENICEPKLKTDGTANVAVCSTSCNICPDSTASNKRYTCVSKTHYGRCVNGIVTIASACEDDSECNSEIYAQTGKICAPTCVIAYYGFSSTCSNDDTTTSTTLAPTTPSVQDLKDQCNAAETANQKYFFIRNQKDASCTTYIYCEIVDDEMEALLIKCASGYYFNSTTGKCTDEEPLICETTTTTTIASAPDTYILPLTSTNKN